MQIRFDLGEEAPPDIYRLIYRSTRVQGVQAADLSDTVLDILAHSREHNRRAGISGALLFDMKGFAQVIEGPPAAVKSLFGHIACDPRHTAVMLLESGLVPTREFATWAMAFVTPLSAVEEGISQEVRAGSTEEGEHLLRRLMALLKEQASY